MYAVTKLVKQSFFLCDYCAIDVFVVNGLLVVVVVVVAGV